MLGVAPASCEAAVAKLLTVLEGLRRKGSSMSSYSAAQA